MKIGEEGILIKSVWNKLNAKKKYFRDSSHSSRLFHGAGALQQQRRRRGKALSGFDGISAYKPRDRFDFLT